METMPPSSPTSVRALLGYVAAHDSIVNSAPYHRYRCNTRADACVWWHMCCCRLLETVLSCPADPSRLRALLAAAAAEVETLLKNHRIFSVHSAYYVREMRVLAYKQLLQSYRSVTLDSMARSFGVSTAFIDAELSRFVAAGRLNCKIDMVSDPVASCVMLAGLDSPGWCYCCP